MFRQYRLGRWVLGAAATLAWFATIGRAMPVTYSNPRDFYGSEGNQICGPFGAVCGAAQAINSFTFLRNYYSGIYQNTQITTGAGATSTQAVTEFGIGTGAPGGSPICGYYNRFGVGANQCGTNRGVNQNYIDTKNDWLNQYAPNTTVVHSFLVGTSGADLISQFLGPELQHHEDIELFWYTLDADGNPTATGHVITPTSITYDDANPRAGATLQYQDPNNPTATYTVTATINNRGYLTFTDAGPSNLGTVGITAGFAESPRPELVPEPGTLWLVGALLVVCGCVRRVKPHNCGH